MTGEVRAENAEGIYVPPSDSSPVVLRYYVPEGTRVQPGDVLVEIDQAPVSEPAAAADKIKSIKGAGKKTALLLVANAQGEVRFVAVPVN